MQAEIYTHNDKIKTFVKNLKGEKTEYKDFGFDWVRTINDDLQAYELAYIMRNFTYDVYQYNDVLNIMLINQDEITK